jgi:hypothetical protein
MARGVIDMSKTLYELELLECGKVKVTWVVNSGETKLGVIQRAIVEPDKLEDGVRELVKAFINKE